MFCVLWCFTPLGIEYTKAKKKQVKSKKWKREKTEYKSGDQVIRLSGSGYQASKWRCRPGLASRWHLANGRKQGQDALATLGP